MLSQISVSQTKVPAGKVRDLEWKIEYYQNQIKQMGIRKEKLQAEFDKAGDGKGENLDGDDFFAFNDKETKVESKLDQYLVELMVEGRSQYFVSKFFHKLLFKH